MNWMNYHHLLYFWTVAREGSVTRAAARLRLAQPTVTAQIRALERSIGDRLFSRAGRNLVLTDVGRMVYRYADEIFALGRELSDALEGRPVGKPMRFNAGIADQLPKLIAFRLLQPALSMPEQVEIVCHEDRPDHLMARLSAHELDLVLSDAPVSPAVHVRAYHHLLGSCGISFFAGSKSAARLRHGFPLSLDRAPLLVPFEHTSLRRSLQHWFDELSIRPLITGEFQDSALMKIFGQAGIGVFPGPTVIEDEICSHYGVSVVGRTDAVVERYYAISVERRLKNPAVVAISEAARGELFSAAK
jgi:LysR family transcriptional regulator, transcriptional activator of nhaA